jgi:glycerate dehydrogenase
MANILVTCSADAEFRRAVLSVLDPIGKVVFLADISEKERSSKLTEADVLFSWNPGRELQPSEFGIISNVKLLQLLSAGADHIPFSQIPPTITIAGNAGAYAKPMAEHILAMLLAINKNLIDRHNKLVQGVFDQTNANRMLLGSTCAILGFGGIGKATAQLLHCFGVRIFAINSSGKTDERVEFIGTLKDLEYVLRLADMIIVALPLTKSTRGLIGRQQLGWIKNDGTLVNVARGDIINEEALFEKLRTHSSFNAAIDTWWVEPFRHGKFHTNYPFLTLPNVLGSPHNSGVVPNSLVTGASHAAENVKRFLNHEPILGLVNRSDYS